MVLTQDTKRFSGLLLAMLVLAAFVIVPACASLPATAMAMSVDGEMVPCGEPGTVMEACPLDRPVSGTPASAPSIDLTAMSSASVAVASVLPLPEPAAFSAIVADESPPPAHLTPLRI